MKRPLVLATLLLVVAASAAEAQIFVFGRATVAFATYYGYAANLHMKWCKAGSNGLPTTDCANGATGPYGDYNITLGSTGYYLPYLWDDAGYIGSSTYPASWSIPMISTPFGNEVDGLLTYPRPLAPTAVTPAYGSVNVNTSFTLQWSDGLDSARRSASWPVTYDIYSSGNEFPETLVFSNIPCNGVGTCSVNVSGLVYTTRYQWRVVAKMKDAPYFAPLGDNTYATSSQQLKFATKWDPSIPLHNIFSYNRNFLRAPGGGGGAFDATGAATNYETQFQFIDTNGGTLYDGDTINIRTNRNYFVSAIGGGGGGTTANVGWNYGYETFTIVRLAGYGPINPGDQVALRSYGGYYVCAEGGGGGAVNANRTSIGPCETFTTN